MDIEFKEIIWTVSAIAAWFAYFLSKNNAQRIKEVDKAKLYLELRSRYLVIRQNIPDRFFKHDMDIHPSDPNWSNIEQYWYQCFDEWFCTNKLNISSSSGVSEFHELWDEYFKQAIQSTLKYKAMRRVLSTMIKGNVSFGKLRTDYERLLNELWIELNNDVSSDAKTIHDEFE
ncbi:hypothetical protein [Methylicorpusculum sp.]|uniref:hypothetical protein n=1 Tax=Methylicorpusculum sp. TaxID=2713644 RepID=UPI00271948A2|nr:hypothetical protein [Methylicorpusculum sp.]MDO8846584.1 hypothetical protein [Methylicorpusculum sp.]